MITRHIADLLYYNECVIVPGLGGFIKAYSPARILHTTHEFFPPRGSVAFNAGLAGNDGLLANHLSNTESISYPEALSLIRQWVDSCHESLKQGKRLSLEGIGELFLNSSDKLEFIPSRQANFNADSYGLPVFYASPVESELVEIPEVQTVKRTYGSDKLRRLVPETLKWAAVLAPFIAFALWGTLNNNFADNYIHNYTGMYSWVRSTPGKTVEVKSLPITKVVPNTASETVESPASILAAENIEFDPNIDSYTELARQNIKISDAAPVTVSTEISFSQEFHIIGGAFRDHNNAMKLVEMLKQQGYQAAIIDTTSGGLFVVSMQGFDSYDQASGKLAELKKTGFASSWILKKSRG